MGPIITHTRIYLPEKKSRKIGIKVEKPVKVATSGIQVDVVNAPSTGTPRALVTRIQALSFDELPVKYTWDLEPSFPKVWQDKSRLMAGDRFTLLEEGVAYRHSYIREILLYIELAGRHLTAVNEDKRLYLHLSEDFVTTFKDGIFKRRATLPKKKESKETLQVHKE
jgi:hypothetical protein